MKNCFKKSPTAPAFSKTIGLYRAGIGPNDSSSESVNLTKILERANIPGGDITKFQKNYMPQNENGVPALHPNVLATIPDTTFEQIIEWYANQNNSAANAGIISVRP